MARPSVVTPAAAVVIERLRGRAGVRAIADAIRAETGIDVSRMAVQRFLKRPGVASAPSEPAPVRHGGLAPEGHAGDAPAEQAAEHLAELAEAAVECESELGTLRKYAGQLDAALSRWAAIMGSSDRAARTYARLLEARAKLSKSIVEITPREDAEVERLTALGVQARAELLARCRAVATRSSTEELERLHRENVALRRSLNSFMAEELSAATKHGGHLR